MRDQRGLTWAWFSDGFLWVVLFNIAQNWTLEKSWGRDQAGCWYGSAFVVAKAVTYTNILVIWIDEQIPERKTVRRPLYQDNDQSWSVWRTITDCQRNSHTSLIHLSSTLAVGQGGKRRAGVHSSFSYVSASSITLAGKEQPREMRNRTQGTKSVLMDSKFMEQAVVL